MNEVVVTFTDNQVSHFRDVVYFGRDRNGDFHLNFKDDSITYIAKENTFTVNVREGEE